jgi:adenosylcobinamide-phosphate synthase
MNSGLLALALALDLLVGDPDGPAHPVRRMGALIRWAEARARSRGGNLRRRGLGLALFVVGTCYLAALFVVHAAELADRALGLRGWLALGVSAVLVWSTLAVRSMASHALAVLAALELGDLPLARLAVARMVGRDTADLDERGVCRALIESMAEGLCDGVVGPLFFAFLGGAPLAVVYRAVNTLDSMVGYRDEAYRELGWASARLDDLFNWLPARKAAFFTVGAALVLRLNPWGAWRTARRDGPRQPSPNSGWPEGAFAGALGIQLGGPLKYRGRPVDKPLLQGGTRALTPALCRRALLLFLCAAGLAVVFYEGAAYWRVR